MQFNSDSLQWIVDWVALETQQWYVDWTETATLVQNPWWLGVASVSALLFQLAPFLGHSRSVHLLVGGITGVVLVFLIGTYRLWPQSRMTQMTWAGGFSAFGGLGLTQRWLLPWLQKQYVPILFLCALSSLAGFSFVYLRPLNEGEQMIATWAVRLLSAGGLWFVMEFHLFRLCVLFLAYYASLLLLHVASICVPWCERYCRTPPQRYGEEFVDPSSKEHLNEAEDFSSSGSLQTVSMKRYQQEASTYTQRALQELWTTFDARRRHFKAQLKPETFVEMETQLNLQKRLQALS